WLQEFYAKHDRYISEAIHPLTFSLKKSVCIDLLSLKPFMQMTNVPVMVLEDRKNKHAEYIANNLRGYVGIPLERADYASNKCVVGDCDKCGGVCNIAKKMERYKRLKCGESTDAEKRADR
ncbi:hypothetical protein LCGC14_2706990, partial [marine sediment metagenome]